MPPRRLHPVGGGFPGAEPPAPPSAYRVRVRTLFLADHDFATRERAMLRRLEVGLLDEGVRLVEALPLDAPDLEGNPLVPTIPYRPSGIRLMRAPRVRQMVQMLQEVEPALAPTDDAEDLLDVIHVWGSGAWPTALDLAEATGAAVAFECWSAAAVRAIRATERRAPSLRGCWLAPNAALRVAADRLASAWPVYLARWGVHSGELTATRPAGPHPPGLVILGAGHDAADHAPVLEAIEAIARDHPDLLAFVDAPIIDRNPSLWKQADRLGLLERLSVIPDMESLRDVILQADVLLLPEAHGEARSVILDAMVARTVIVARADPLIEAFAAPDIAVLVEGPTRGAWVKALRRVLEDAEAARRITERARERILRDRPVHKQVEAILTAHNLLTTEGSIAFPDASRGS